MVTREWYSFETSKSTEVVTYSLYTSHKVTFATLLCKELGSVMTQRHLEAAFLPSGSSLCDINTVGSLVVMLSLILEGEPVHCYSTTRVLVPTSYTLKW